MDTFPILKLELQGMKLAIATALTEYTTRFDSDLRNALDALCTPENLKRIISDAADKEIKNAITNEIAAFFRYGEGREVIKKAVEAQLATK